MVSSFRLSFRLHVLGLAEMDRQGKRAFEVSDRLGTSPDGEQQGDGKEGADEEAESNESMRVLADHDQHWHSTGPMKFRCYLPKLHSSFSLASLPLPFAPQASATSDTRSRASGSPVDRGDL